MLTCKSPRKVMLLAYNAARGVLPERTSKFARKDFTLPQLFACLAVKEQMGRTEQNERDAIDNRLACNRSRPIHFILGSP